MPSPGDLPDQGIELGSPGLQVDSLPAELPGMPEGRTGMKKNQPAQLHFRTTTVLALEFSRPEYWSGEPFPSPGHLPNPGIKPRSPVLQADSLPAEPQGKLQNNRLRRQSTVCM